MTAKEFCSYVADRVIPGKRMYLFFDEVQRISGWENAVNSFRVDLDCDIYVTGSNAHLLSSKLSTYLSGRYVEIKVLPLSFREFLDFHGYTVAQRKSPTGQLRKRILDAEGESYDPKELYQAYARFGGMPMLADVGLETDKVSAALDGVYSAVVVRDILENIIYFELLRRGYDVAIGKLDNKKVDFIATKTDEKKYIQVTESMNAPETRERELSPLRKIPDNYEKIVIAMECDLHQDQDGIKIVGAIDFLLE